ncbi:transposase [Bradyrhizobium sp. USDA 4520]
MSRQIVAESYALGAVMLEFARWREISPQQLSAWRRTARDGLLKLPKGAEPVATRPSGSTAIQDRWSSGEASAALGGLGPRHEFVQTGDRPEIGQCQLSFPSI